MSEHLALARRILEIVREQREVVAGKGTVPLGKGTVPLSPKGDCPPEEALDRFMALAEERQECMDRFDRLQEAKMDVSNETAGLLDGPEMNEKGTVPLRPKGDCSPVAADIEDVFREAARIDAENRLVLEKLRERLRSEIGQVKQGREALRSYGFQESGGADSGEGAFVDRKK